MYLLDLFLTILKCFWEVSHLVDVSSLLVVHCTNAVHNSSVIIIDFRVLYSELVEYSRFWTQIRATQDFVKKFESLDVDSSWWLIIHPTVFPTHPAGSWDPSTQPTR